MDDDAYDNMDVPGGPSAGGYCAVITGSDPARMCEVFTRMGVTMPTIHDQALLARDLQGRLCVAQHTGDTNGGQPRPAPEPAQGSMVKRLVTVLQGPLGCLFVAPGQPAIEPMDGPVGGVVDSVVYRIVSSVPAGGQMIVAQGSGHPCALDALLRQTDTHMTTLTIAQVNAELDALETAEQAAAHAAARVLAASTRDRGSYQRQRWVQRSRAYQRRLRSA